MGLKRRVLLLSAALGALCHGAWADTSDALTLSVDATDTAHRIFTVHETIPVAGPGPLTLLYPRWETASHAPTVAVADLAGLVITVDGKRLPWQRDPVDVHAFHVDVPAGALAVTADFQYLSPTRTGALAMTRDLLTVQWQSMLLYPAGHPVRDLTVAASLRLPPGFQAVGALDRQGTDGDTITYAPTLLETLVDGPVYAGRHVAQADLGGDGAPVRLDLLADRPDSLAVTPDQLAGLRALVTQTRRLFRGAPYDHYDAIVTLTDLMQSGGGVEHLRSGENMLSPGYFTDAAHQLTYLDLIAHEYVHAWNGRYRQPADMAAADFNTPTRDGLLWVYEGLTQYWGHVLAARAGLRGGQDTLDMLALDAAAMQARPGRSWKSLGDSTNDPLFDIGHAVSWRDWQRREDYYPEGVLLWLDVDMLLREKSGGTKSLDDFARSFFASPPAPVGGQLIRPYTFDDVCSALNALVPYDWAAYFTHRLETHDDAGLLDGLARAGYRLVFTDTPTEAFRQAEVDGGALDLGYAIGLSVGKGGVVRTVAWQGPAFRAGVGIGNRIQTVNGAPYTAEALTQAVRNAAITPVTLGLEVDGQAVTARIDYAGGLRYPRLERAKGRPDRMAALLAPLKD
ncbi:MAG: peptidase M61 [Azospirillaceae bacterium]|nr:peptidase M61 [Azospirillaceae bacterium]